MLKDLRHAVRVLLQAKGWTTVVVAVAGARHRRQHGAFQRGQRTAADEIPVKDPDTLVRFRWSGRNDMVTSSSDYGSVTRRP